MLELNITHLVEAADDMPMLSGSCAELGQDAGRITWQNSLQHAATHAPLLASDNARELARNYFKGFGAWSDEEIAAWSDQELEALVVQYIAGCIREMEPYESDEAYLKAAEQGAVSGCLHKDDDGQWYAILSD